MLRILTLVIGLHLTAELATALDVYIVAGQSNGYRLSSLGAWPGRQDDHSIYYFPIDCSSRPTTSKMQVLESLHPSVQGAGLAAELLKVSDADIIVVQYCVCGTSLYDPINWYPGDDPANGQINDKGLYASCLETLKDARRQVEEAGHTWDVQGLFWHQGESDANAHADEYEATLRRLFGRFRSDLGESLPIVAAHIRPLDDPSRTINSALDTLAAADPHLAVVESADLTFESPTDVHFNTPGCLELGHRLGTAYAELRKK